MRNPHLLTEHTDVIIDFGDLLNGVIHHELGGDSLLSS